LKSANREARTALYIRFQKHIDLQSAVVAHQEFHVFSGPI
jgi:hypothetical protein